jgi:hypothetical protein
MGTTIKVTITNTDEFQVRHRAQRMGLSVSEFCRRAIQKDLTGVMAEMPDAVVDKVERGSRGARAVAAYLSPPLATAIARLSRDTQRSTSWVLRDLIRCELRRRGILPTPSHATVEIGNREATAP